METKNDNLETITITGNGVLLDWLEIIKNEFTARYPASNITYEEIIVFLINDTYSSSTVELNKLVQRGDPSIIAGIMDTITEK